MTRKLIIELLLLLSVALVATGAVDTWAQFESSNQFSVSYPEDWSGIGNSQDELELRSSPGGAEGMVAKRGQAAISVLEAQHSPDWSLDKVIGFYTKETKVLSKKSIQGSDAVRGCRTIEEVISSESAVPPEDVPISPPLMINTDYFCEIENRKFVGFHLPHALDYRVPSVGTVNGWYRKTPDDFLFSLKTHGRILDSEIARLNLLGCCTPPLRSLVPIARWGCNSKTK